MKERKISMDSFGQVNTDKVIAQSGQIMVFVPIEKVNKELDFLLDLLTADFKQKHRNAQKLNYQVCVAYSFGNNYCYCNGDNGCDAEFNLEITIWDQYCDDEVEFYEGIAINASDKFAKELRKIIWDAMGKALFAL